MIKHQETGRGKVITSQTLKLNVKQEDKTTDKSRNTRDVSEKSRDKRDVSEAATTEKDFNILARVGWKYS